MAKKIKDNKLNRYFMITKALFMLTPILCYIYILLKASTLGLSFQEVLVQDSQTVIIFLIAMLNPYIAYIVKLIQNNLEKNNMKFACINMILLLIAEALTMNLFYFMVLLYVFYKAIRYYHISVSQVFQSINIKQVLFDGGGSLFVMMISCISLFASIKLM